MMRKLVGEFLCRMGKHKDDQILSGYPKHEVIWVSASQCKRCNRLLVVRHDIFSPRRPMELFPWDEHCIIISTEYKSIIKTDEDIDKILYGNIK